MLILMRTLSKRFVSSWIFCVNVLLNVFCMKWKIINNGFSPQFKCGAELAGAGVMNLLGGMGNTMIQKEVADEQIYYQMLENQKNRDWQTSQAELNRQFQANQQNVSFGQQQHLQSQQQQYNLQSMAQQAKYNSPVYQRQQLEAAGINPQVYFGSKGSFAGSSAISGGAPSAPSPASGSMPGSVSGLSPVSYQPRALDVAAIAGAMKNFAEAKKLGVESDWLPKTLQADIMNKKSYSDLNSALKLGAQINNEIQNAKIPYAIKQAAADLAKTISEAELNDQRKLTESSQQKVNESISRLNDSLEKLNAKEYERYGIFLHYYENMLQEQLNNLRADTGLKGSESRQAESQSDVNEANSAQIRYYNDVLQSKGVKESLVQQSIEAGKAAVNSNVLSKKQAKQMDYLIEQAAYASDMKEFTYWSNQVNQFVGTIGQAASQFYGAGALRELIKLRQTQQLPTSGFGASKRPSPYEPYGR